MRRATPFLVAGIAVAACGSKASTEDQVMAAEVNGIQALLSDHPERSCTYVTDHDACIQGILTLKAMKLEVKATAGIPDDWRDRLKHAKIVVHGDRATLAPGPTGKTARFVLRNGHWLAEN
jgi:hypothetical protein